MPQNISRIHCLFRDKFNMYSLVLDNRAIPKSNFKLIASKFDQVNRLKQSDSQIHRVNHNQIGNYNQVLELLTLNWFYV